jgi:heat shock protein HslJ
MIGPKFLVSGLCASVLSVAWPSFATSDTLPPLSDTLPPLYGPNGLSFWTLVSFADGPQDADAIFQFEGDTFSLDVPCFQRPWGYRYDGAFAAIPRDGNYIDRCGGTVPPTIVAFDAVMPKVTMLQLKGDQLSLADADNRTLLVLQRLEATGLENRKWHISEFYDGTSLVAANDRLSFPAAITFVHGDVHGSAGCGGLIGDYSLDGTRVTIRVGSILAGFCYPQDEKTNDFILDALNAARALELQDNRVALHDSQGRIQVVLTPWRNDQP